MNVLMINGSPKGSKSNTFQLTNAFLKGMSAVAEINLETLEVSKLNLHPCKGCFTCWNKTPGICVQKDDMEMVIERILWADLVIFSFPLYYFSVPGELKVLIDRMLPMTLPFMKKSEYGSHSYRYDLSGKRFLVISTCGFYTTKGNYDSVFAMFDRMYGKDGYETLLCAQSELFRVPELKDRTTEYLRHVEKAGAEFATGEIDEKTRALLDDPLYERDVFERMADASWGLEEDGSLPDAGSKKKMRVFTRQMAALYNPSSWKKKDLVLEMDYTDIGEKYQIVLGKDKSEVLEKDFRTPDTIVKTPSTVWRDIAQGKIRGDQALMEGKYTVSGDFGLMMNWGSYFGSNKEKPKTQTRDEAEEKNASNNKASAGTQAKSEPRQRKTIMLSMLLGWSALWTVLIAGTHQIWPILLVLALTPVLFFRYCPTVWNTVTTSAVLLFCVLMELNVPDAVLLIGSEAAFGAMWLSSCFFGNVPLCAEYSCYGYGGREALNNPMFIKTNRIIALGWGFTYVLEAAISFLFLILHFEQGIALAAWIGPALMGILTILLQKWIPSRIASGKWKRALNG